MATDINNCLFGVKMKYVDKYEFSLHTSRYLKLAEKEGELIITYHNQPRFYLKFIKNKTIHDLKGLLSGLKIHGDINEPILLGYDEW